MLAITVLEGREVDDKIACLDEISQRIVVNKINYDFLGPIDNSVVFILLQTYDIKIGKSDVLGTVFGLGPLSPHPPTAFCFYI
jgi:hypothetical protein